MQEIEEQKIILVEDDQGICGMVRDYLKGESFQVDVYHKGETALRAFADGDYVLALVDLMLPDMSGMEVIRAIRESSSLPIIIITAKDTDTDKVMGLNVGADDYVVKPFSLIELTARIRANIRRRMQYDNTVRKDRILTYKDLEINISKRTVTQSGRPLQLTRTEFDILSLLAANPGRAFSKEALYELVWKEPYYGEENVLNSHMNRLRAKLKNPANPEIVYIKTLWGTGYKMEEE
ncbi:response regulator transcription factor [Eubacterium sp. An3]|uniref:response regulator transcription factor n=1 Tax=Eubacterium sp. An3 TaxID=1965628 RepID=UPI000B39D01C|nr:response regulator transcription factor [Eubacterium sp. An3]OUO28328.1 DNA-binding response regulator [Eubacterium sp. An3]